MKVIFTADELKQFLIALDRELTKPCSIVLIGGAVATLHFQTKTGTLDIDTFQRVEELAIACEAVRAKNPKLQIPFDAAGPAQGPSRMAERYEEYKELPLKNLRILVPEKHDWILLKTARCDEKDITDIRALTKKYSINPDILKRRFIDEMLPQNPGSDEDLIYRYLYMISVIFDEAVAVEHESAVKQL